MTGFGRGVVTKGGIRYVVEVKSVNNRFCEVRVQAPKDCLELEHLLTARIREKFERGKFDVLVKMETVSKEARRNTLDVTAIKSRWKELETIRKALGIHEQVTLQAALHNSSPNGGQTGSPLDAIKKFEQAAAAAFEKLTAFREKEGRDLARDILKRSWILNASLESIEKHAEGSSADRFQKLKDRVALLLSDKAVDSARLDTELAMLADKTDVTEEIVRLKSHLKNLSQSVNAKGSIGRKIDFLLQEINREINTIGSKAADLGMTDKVVTMKMEVEKIREQAQNLE
jgi:uncharacterized protein (TIGR00255 family)